MHRRRKEKPTSGRNVRPESHLRCLGSGSGARGGGCAVVCEATEPQPTGEGSCTLAGADPQSVCRLELSPGVWGARRRGRRPAFGAVRAWGGRMSRAAAAGRHGHRDRVQGCQRSNFNGVRKKRHFSDQRQCLLRCRTCRGHLSSSEPLAFVSRRFLPQRRLRERSESQLVGMWRRW